MYYPVIIYIINITVSFVITEDQSSMYTRLISNIRLKLTHTYYSISSSNPTRTYDVLSGYKTHF